MIDIVINLDDFHNFLLCSHVIYLNLFHLMIDKVSAYFSVVLSYFLEFKERIGIPPPPRPFLHIVASIA